MSFPDYSYEVDAMGRVSTRACDASWKSTGFVRLDGIQRTADWLGPFDSSARDLLRVAAAVLDADRLSPRRPPQSSGMVRQLTWQRRIRLRIAVEDPHRWEVVLPKLHELLSFMTDDKWELSFTRATPTPTQQVLFCDDSDSAIEVSLFSGGLDSVAGLYARSMAIGGKYIAVSACGNEVQRRAQASALTRMRELGVNATWVKIFHQLQKTHRTRTGMEPTQRSRGLLFLALGAAVASELGLPSFNVYETGVGCINIPMSPAQIASQGTRAMHPFTLAKSNDIFSMALDRPARATVPFFFHTKGQLCREAGAALERFAPLAMSCDEGEGHKPDAMEHCGLCTSCIFRRIAIFAARIEDRTRYRDIASRRHGSYELRLFEYHATQLAGCATFNDLVELAPDVRFAPQAPTGVSVSKDAAKTKIAAMYAAYRQEISDFFTQARPALRPRSRTVQTENECDLFAAAG